MDWAMNLEEESIEGVEEGIEVGAADLAASVYEKIELVWPGKDTVARVEQMANGQWHLGAGNDGHRVNPLLDLDHYPPTQVDATSLVIDGDRLVALRTLGRSLRRCVRLAYVDAPRIGVDEVAASFRGDALLVYSSWLSVMRAHLAAIEPLLRRDGVVALHVGETEAGFARLVADEMFRGQHIGTVVWQRAYAPRNMKGMQKFTSTHDCLLLYAKQRDALPPVGLRRAPTGYGNSDGDPRGAWKAEHKGAKARRANSDFDTFVPPYRWRIAKGTLPDGLWRLSPLTGVIWGKPRETGKFPLRIEVADGEGRTANKELVLEVLSHGTVAAAPELPWILEEIQTSGTLRIETERLPPAILEQEYSAACIAGGGEPYRASPKRPGSGRFWEFARDTLLVAYQKDAVYLGRDDPTAIPHPKSYAPPEGELVVENQQTWWPGRVRSGSKTTAFAGYTEDATKHLKAMKELGLIETEVSSAKPEHLLARLLDIFTDRGDIVLEIFGTSADMASVALKRLRRFVLLAGSSDRDLELLRNCALPRLKAVVDGKDTGLHEKVAQIRMRADAYLPYEGGGAFATARVGDWLIERRKGEDLAALNWATYDDPVALRYALLTAEGYLPANPDADFGIAFVDPASAAVVIRADQFLTMELAGEWVTRLTGQYSAVTLYYFRCSTDFDPAALPVGVTSKRVPFDLGV